MSQIDFCKSLSIVKNVNVRLILKNPDEWKDAILVDIIACD